MSSVSKSWSELLESLLNREDLSNLEATNLIRAWLNEELSPVQTGAYLTALRAKGVTGVELGSMAKILREESQLPYLKPQLEMVDTCGTGGDGADTFNISTAVAFTASACGAKVAKHGNRSASGKVGSADVLEGLGIKLDAPLESVVEAINHVGITFLFAPAWHPSLINLAPLRRSLGIRTIFNLLGPLVNPLRPSSQVLGVAKPELLDPMAEALKDLGLQKAIVVYGAGGLDEASLEGDNELRFLENGVINSKTIKSNDYGLTSTPNTSLKGGDLERNTEILKAVLQGKGTNSQQDVVALNTSLVLWVSGVETDIQSGVDKALACLKSGLAWDQLEKLRERLDSTSN